MIHAWHAHIYYDAATKPAAAALYAALQREFPEARMGRMHDVPVGPHPQAMFQVLFLPALFPALVPYLALHRAGLVVLVHPETGRPKDDHLLNALWMGAMLPLDASVLPETE
jgi:DOPA 4,5-dioxygenase